MSLVMYLLLLSPVSGWVKDPVQDLKYLSSIFPGFYDNVKQYEDDIREGIPKKDRHVHLSLYACNQNIPILNDRVNFYLEEFTNDDPQELLRQRIYSFGVDENSEIKLEFYLLSDQSKYAHAWPNSLLFLNLTHKDIQYVSGCDVFWDRVNEDLFHSHMGNSCVVPYHNEKIIITDTNYLSPSYLTVHEKWTLENGTVISSIPVPYNLTKATSPYRRHSFEINTA